MTNAEFTFHYALDASERAAEEAVLAASGAHFASFAGSQREAYDALIAQTPIADGVTVQQVDRDGVRGWWVRPQIALANRAILFVHGGAYMLGTASAYRGLASQIVVRAGVAAFVPDYPLAPEQPFPAAQDGVEAAYHWLLNQQAGRVALIGDSAGGGLVLSLLAKTQADRVAGVVTFSPWIDLALAGSSFSNPETHDPIFQPEILATAASLHLAGADPRDGRASPLYSIPVELPPLLIQVGSDELLLDDARRYAERAAAKGGLVKLEIYDDLHHVFQRSVDELPSAKAALDRVAAFLTTLWPRARQR
ncbi:alpha/beta hydrolase fold domain-containing protein [Devosia sp. UYZn731]|uniref:alpha/beta hydrolase fold domain-containing protein n=1 Tax=Devosia sp. UYZn731 TaxID=3156345 RepID=UPI003396AA2A